MRRQSSSGGARIRHGRQNRKRNGMTRRTRHRAPPKHCRSTPSHELRQALHRASTRFTNFARTNLVALDADAHLMRTFVSLLLSIGDQTRTQRL
jgi:hypothetical protein